MEQLNLLGNLEQKKVMFLWNSTVKEEQLSSYRNNIKTKVGESGTVQFENIERLSLNDHTPSSYDVVIIEPYTLFHSKEILSKIIKLVKPAGKVSINQAIAPSAEAAQEKVPTLEQFKSSLVLVGYTKIETPVLVPANEEITKQLKELSQDPEPSVYYFQFEKPNFEIGASTKLSFGQPAQNVAAVWKLDSNDVAEDDLIDSDQLLSSEDLQKPDPASLKVCGTTGKRKACKDCSCGLAEELDAEAKGKQQASGDPAPKSSCGSCYLGDAFRCATCPYLGMPAFKPGEKVSISDFQLKADV